MNTFDLFGNPNHPHSLQPEVAEVPEFAVPLNEEGGEVETETRQAPHFFILLSLTFLALGALAFQCYHLQVSQNRANQTLATNNSRRILTLPADRGLIVDSTGVTLAQNSQQLALAIDPSTLPTKKADRQKVYDLLQAKAGIDQKTITFIETNRLQTPDIFAIKTNLTHDESLLYQEWFTDVPGVVVQQVPIRTYASYPSLGQLLGYVGSVNQDDIKKGFTVDQRIGKTGLEQWYNAMLMGTPGKQIATVDASGKVVQTSVPEQEPVAGQTLKLSLNTHIQQIVASALQDAITYRNTKFGDATKNLGASAVVMDPNTGAILSMVSLPDYDANLFAQGISQTDYQSLLSNASHPLLNRTIQGQYPSGSTIKPLIAGAALDSGIVTTNTKVVTPEAIYVGSYRYPDWKTHGLTDIKQAIAQSNDIFFYALGGGWADQNIKGLGIDRLNAALDAYGLGSKTGVDLPGEAAGLTPGPDWKKKTTGESWYIGDTYHQSIGQGYLLATPLQMASAAAAIANGGTLYQPQLGWSLVDPTTNKETLLPHKVLNSHWLSSASLQAVQEGMAMTTQPGGTAQLLGHMGITSAGKTGTAQFGSQGLTHSWYIGYAPVDHPQYAYAILIEGDGNVSEATEGSEPVAEEILRGLFNLPLQPGQQLDTQALLP